MVAEISIELPCANAALTNAAAAAVGAPVIEHPTVAVGDINVNPSNTASFAALRSTVGTLGFGHYGR